MTETFRKFVFLDIDGVLNSERYVASREKVETDELWTLEDIDPAAVHTLNALVARSGAAVVVSSSWRHHHTLEEIAALLRERGFLGEVLDATPRLFGASRGTEIRTWLEIHAGKTHAFVVLDDDECSAELEAHWVLTDAAVGLTETDVERALLVLATVVSRPDEAESDD